MDNTMTLAKLQAKPCNPKAGLLSPEQTSAWLKLLSGWQRAGEVIVKTYHFDNYYQTIAFVNAVAWVSHQADHHPDLTVGYNRCEIRYSTHSVGGLSENDLVCAARVEGLMTAES